MELGIYTFGELTPETDSQQTPAKRMRELIEEMELADQVGLDVFAVGEHHRSDFIVSAPAVVLAAGAERTRNIRLSSAVNVISSDDPVRIFQQFATLDLLSGGRAEIMAGRGSFIESFPLFGYDLNDYDQLFRDKLLLLIELTKREVITWPGTRHRLAIDGRGVYPRPIQDPLPIWVAVGGSPESAVRTGKLGLPMALAIIGGMPERFAPFAELFRHSARETGHDPAPQLSINSHGLVGDDGDATADQMYPALKLMFDRIGRERGWGPMTREQFDAGRALRGATFVGSSHEVIDKILFQWEIFHHDRFLIQFAGATLPHDVVMRSIELFGREVAPAVRTEIARRSAAPVATPAAIPGVAAG